MLFLSDMFFVFSVVGCGLETAFTLAVSGKFEIRKTTVFLPLCPVYGVGALLMYYTLTPFADYPFIVILLGAAVGTAAEYLYGFLALRLFNVYIWDYRGERHNFMGLITPFFSFIWGLLSELLIYVIAPTAVPLIKNFSPIISAFILLLNISELILTLIMLKNIKHGKDPNQYLCPVIKRA